MRGASTLKSVSRRRSLVGRVLIPGGAASVRERNVPAMMRIANQHIGTAHKQWKVEGRRLRAESRKLALPLQSCYAWLVNSAGPMVGCGDARPHLFPSADPGAVRH